MANTMKGLVLVVGLFQAFLTFPARADDAQPSVEARAIISRQLDAFAHDDGPAAYALAAPGLKTMFTDADVFMDMVRSKYAPVYRHRSIDFGTPQVDGDAIAITATIVDGDNHVWTALYKLQRQPDGQWLINGCMLIKSQESAL